MKLETVSRVISAVVGELPLQKSGNTFRPAGKKRDTKPGAVPENTGYIEEQVCAELKLKLNATGAQGIDAFTSADEDTLTIYTSKGKVYSMPGAWAVEPGTLGEGEMDITYNSGTSPRVA